MHTHHHHLTAPDVVGNLDFLKHLTDDAIDTGRRADIQAVRTLAAVVRALQPAACTAMLGRIEGTDRLAYLGAEDSSGVQLKAEPITFLGEQPWTDLAADLAARLRVDRLEGLPLFASGETWRLMLADPDAQPLAA